MKKVAIFLFSAVLMIMGGDVLSAQGKYGADSAECIKYLSYYQEYFKQKNYDEAIPHWSSSLEKGFCTLSSYCEPDNAGERCRNVP